MKSLSAHNFVFECIFTSLYWNRGEASSKKLWNLTSKLVSVENRKIQRNIRNKVGSVFVINTLSQEHRTKGTSETKVVSEIV